MGRMGVKGRATLAILFIFVLLGSMWFYGRLDDHWEYCPKVHHPKDQFLDSRVGGNDSGGGAEAPLRECPSQRFQVSVLLSNLKAAPVSTDDILLEPYLASWDELIKFMEALGQMVRIISQEIEAKTSIIRDLAQREEEEEDMDVPRGDPAPASPVASPRNGAYVSLRSMIDTELLRGLVNFEKHSDSGCRTLLRLHRALLWLQHFLQKLSEGPGAEGRPLRSPSDLCREAYRTTLAHHHSWWVQQAAQLAFVAMPERAFFYRLVCVQNQAEAGVVLGRVVQAIQVVYERTEQALEEHGMLELP